MMRSAGRPFGDQTLRELQAEEFDKRRNIFLLCHSSNVSGRLDAGHGNAQRQKVLKQVSVITGDLVHPTLSRRDEAGP